MARASSRPTCIGRLITSINDAGFVRLQRQARVLQKLEQRLLDYLPTPLNLHCRIGNISNNTLILYADTAAWATRLRFMVPELKKQLRRDKYMTVDGIEVRILPPNLPALTPAPKHPPPRLSADNAGMIESLARGIGDERLARALHNLARRHRDSDT